MGERTLPDRARIAIAVGLVAISHKPPALDLSSYILQLQQAFPRAYDRTAVSEAVGSWVLRTKELEKRLASAETELDQAKLDLRARVARYPSIPPQILPQKRAAEEDPPSTKPKKKKKIKQFSEEESHRPKATFKPLTLKFALKGVDKSSEPLLHTSLNLLSSFLSVVDPASPAAPSTLRTHLQQIITILSKVLSPVPTKAAVTTISNLLPHLLSCPDLPRFQLSDDILKPLIQAFVSLSKLSVESMLSSTKNAAKTGKEGDLRPTLLSFLVSQTSVHPLLLPLATQTLYVIVSEVTPSSLRSEKICRKEALWYICSLIQACALDSLPELVLEKATAHLRDIVRLQPKKILDDMEYEIVMGVVEKVWLFDMGSAMCMEDA